MAAALGAPVHAATASLRQAAVVHMDETRCGREGGREGTSGNWLWAAIQPRPAIYNSALPSRARYVVHHLIDQQPVAVVVCDRYAAYGHIDPRQRQVCGAHLLRHFNRIAQRAGQPGRVGARLLGLGYVLFRWRERGRSTQAQFGPLQRRVRQALQRGAAQRACTRTANTCANILELRPALWCFTRHAGVEPTNHSTEQALRAIVLERTISGPTRSHRGDPFIARGFSAAETCRRQGRDLLAYLHQVMLVWIDGTAPPSLLPQPAPTA